jgi:prophage regulatory protein
MSSIIDNILRLPDVKKRTGLSRSSIYAFMKEGKFPKSSRLGSRSIGWSESEISAWINSRFQPHSPVGEGKMS